MAHQFIPINSVFSHVQKRYVYNPITGGVYNNLTWREIKKTKSGGVSVSNVDNQRVYLCKKYLNTIKNYGDMASPTPFADGRFLVITTGEHDVAFETIEQAKKAWEAKRLDGEVCIVQIVSQATNRVVVDWTR